MLSKISCVHGHGAFKYCCAVYVAAFSLAELLNVRPPKVTALILQHFLTEARAVDLFFTLVYTHHCFIANSL